MILGIFVASIVGKEENKNQLLIKSLVDEIFPRRKT